MNKSIMNIYKLVHWFVIIVLAYFIICNVIIHLYARQKAADNADTMVILGAQVMGNPAVPHPVLKGRLDKALVYLKNNPNTKVVVCGGQGEGEPATEASVMAGYLIDNGIDASRVYLEDKSTRTAQQFVYANKVLPLGKTVVVTNDFHLLRSIMLAKRSGIKDVSGLSAPLSFRNQWNYVSLIREPLALINSWLFDHPLNNDN